MFFRCKNVTEIKGWKPWMLFGSILKKQWYCGSSLKHVLASRMLFHRCICTTHLLKKWFCRAKKKASEIERKETCGYRIGRERKRERKESTSSYLCICILDVHIAKTLKKVENGATCCTKNIFLLCWSGKMCVAILLRNRVAPSVGNSLTVCRTSGRKHEKMISLLACRVEGVR